MKSMMTAGAMHIASRNALVDALAPTVTLHATIATARANEPHRTQVREKLFNMTVPSLGQARTGRRDHNLSLSRKALKR